MTDTGTPDVPDDASQAVAEDAEASSQLVDLRGQIDDVDAELVALLGRRFGLTRQIGELKMRAGWPSKDTVRESHQHLRLALLAEEQGIDAATVLRVFDEITSRVVEEHETLRGEQV